MDSKSTAPSLSPSTTTNASAQADSKQGSGDIWRLASDMWRSKQAQRSDNARGGGVAHPEMECTVVVIGPEESGKSTLLNGYLEAKGGNDPYYKDGDNEQTTPQHFALFRSSSPTFSNASTTTTPASSPISSGGIVDYRYLAITSASSSSSRSEGSSSVSSDSPLSTTASILDTATYGCHLWEVGGGLEGVGLLDVVFAGLNPLSPSTSINPNPPTNVLQSTLVCLTLDLSKPQSIIRQAVGYLSEIRSKLLLHTKGMHFLLLPFPFITVRLYVTLILNGNIDGFSVPSLLFYQVQPLLFSHPILSPICIPSFQLQTRRIIAV